MRHSNSYYLFLILQIDLRDKGALEMVFASTRYNFHLFSCSAVLTLFHFQIIINSFLFCKFVSSMFFIVRQFALQIWCCRTLRWTKSCGWKCAEAIAILWQQCHWDNKSSRSYVFSRLQEGIYHFAHYISAGATISNCFLFSEFVCRCMLGCYFDLNVGLLIRSFFIYFYFNSVVTCALKSTN